jgi:uncharacterized protein (DUF58 family)
VAQFTPVKKRVEPLVDGRVYANLDDLVRIQFQVSGFSFLPRQPIHSVLSGRHASRLRGRGLNFEELRGYLPGDDTRNIDWKVSARADAPYVRVYSEERDRPVWLLVDQRQSMFFGSRWKLKSVAAAEAAAAAAWRVLAVKDRVGAVIFNDRDLRVVPPHRSRERVMRILGEVVAMNHALRADATHPQAPEMLNEALARVGPLAPHDCLIVLVTDGYGADEATRRHVTRVTRHNDALALLLFDPMEQALPAADRLTVSDGERLLDVDTRRASVRDRYRAGFDERLARFETVSRRYAVPVLKLDASKPLLEQVREQLGYHPGSRRF